MGNRLYGLPEELRLEIEQGNGSLSPNLAEKMIEAAASQARRILGTDKTIQGLREIQSVIGPHGSISRVQAGGVRITPGEGIGVYSDGVYKTRIIPTGTLMIGSNIEEPSTTTEIFFTEATDYNGETFAAGDFLIGDNSTSTPNMKYNAIEGRLEFRLGQTVLIIQDTDGALTFANNTTGLSFAATDASQSMFIKSTNLDDLWIVNSVEGKRILQNIKLTDSTTASLQWREHPSVATATQLTVENSTAGGRLALGFDHFIDFLPQSGSGSATVWFNERGHDIDVVWKDEANTQAVKLDAGLSRVLIHGQALGETLGAFLNGTTVPASTTYHSCPFKIGVDAVTNSFPIPQAGTLANLAVRISVAQPASGSLVCTLYVNNVATALTVTIPAGAAAPSNHVDSTNTVALAANDILRWVFQNNATAASATLTAVTTLLIK
jgi:hypothetical protein